MKKSLLFSILIFVFLNALSAHPGIGIAMDSKGNVYYTDLTHVWKITPDGDLSIAVENVHTHQLYIDQQDNIYGEHEWYKGEATDQWGNYVWRLNKEGVFEIIIPEVVGFLDNNTLVRDREGNSYWTRKLKDHQLIQCQSSDGHNFTFSDFEFQDIRWMHFSEAGKCLLVVDKLSVIKVFPTGEVKIIADNLKENTAPFNGVADRHYIFGLTTDSQGHVYVANYGAQQLNKINTHGNVSTIYNSNEGWSPSGILVDHLNNMWVMEYSTKNKTRIVSIDADGNKLIYGE